MSNTQQQPMSMKDLQLILDEQLRAMSDESIKADNKLFARQAQKTKEVANIAGKLIAITAQQLYANEMGASVEVPALGIEEGTILRKDSRMAKLLN